MSSISDIYGEVYDQYMCSLLNAGETEEGNPAERSLVYRYFFEEYLLPYGVAASGEEKEGEYIIPKTTNTGQKQKDTLDLLYRAWEKKKEIEWRSKNIPMLLMLGYNRYLMDRKIHLFLRLMLTYMTERPVRYREGHVFYESEDDDGEFKERQMYLSFLAELYSIAEGRSFRTVDHVEMKSVQNALLKLLLILQESGETDEKIRELLLRIPPLEMRKITDGLLRTSLHGNIKDYFFNMGYPVTEKKKKQKKETDIKETKNGRKQDKSLAFLERCIKELDYQILSSDERKLHSEDGGKEYRAACRKLFWYMNRMANRPGGYTRAVVPLMTHKDILLCIIGKDYFCELYKKFYSNPPSEGVFDPKRQIELRKKEEKSKDKNKEEKKYVYAIMQMVATEKNINRGIQQYVVNDLLCFGPYKAFDSFDAAELEYNTRIKEKDFLLAYDNQNLLAGIKNGNAVIPEVFREYFALSAGFDEELPVREGTQNRLSMEEEEGLQRLRKKSKGQG